MASKSDIEKRDIQDVDEAVAHVKKMPRDQQNQVMQKLEMFSGPIPAPHILKQYDEMDPGAAKQIIDNGVQESTHRRKMENKILEISKRRGRRRDWMAFIIGILSIGAGFFLIWKDHYVVGTIFSGVSLVSLVGTFLDNEDSDNSDDSNNEESKKE